MVEAAGIEPASEGIPQPASTGLSSSVHLVERFSKRKSVAQPAQVVLHPPDPEHARQTILLVGVSSGPQERPQETAALSIRQRLQQVLQLIVSHLFNEVDGTSACSFCFTTSVESISPPTFFNYKGKLRRLSIKVIQPACKLAGTNLLDQI